VGYSKGPEVAENLERNNIIVNYQATPEEEGFTASGALRMGVSEMTRFGFGKEEFKRLAHLIAECVKGADVKDEVIRFRSGYTEMKYCFNDKDVDDAMQAFCKATGI
jgi:aminomethyltransferase